MSPLIAVTCSGWFSPPPALTPANGTDCSAASSLIVESSIAPKVGRSFTALTVTSKVRTVLALSLFVARLPSNPPSVTVTVIVAAPDWSASG